VFHPAAALPRDAVLPALTPSFFRPAAPAEQQELRAADDMDELQLVDSDESDGEVEVFSSAPLPVAASATLGITSAIAAEQQELRAADDMDEFDFDSTVDLQSIASQELSAAASTPATCAAAPIKYSKAAPLVVATSTAIGQSLDVRACRFFRWYLNRVCVLFRAQAIDEGGSDCDTPVSSPSK
jgi:hypothetical protein